MDFSIFDSIVLDNDIISLREKSRFEDKRVPECLFGRVSFKADSALIFQHEYSQTK